MTPYELEILLWYHTRNIDHPHDGERPPIWEPTIDKLFRDEMLTSNVVIQSNTAYRIAERGKVYIEAILTTPLPEKRWVMPEGK